MRGRFRTEELMRETINAEKVHLGNAGGHQRSLEGPTDESWNKGNAKEDATRGADKDEGFPSVQVRSVKEG